MATLDVRVPGITTEELIITDQLGIARPVYDGLPLRTALTLMELAPIWDAGQITAEQAHRTIGGLLPVFSRMDPTVTQDDLLDGFDIQDMAKIIYFLFSRVEERAGRGDLDETAPETEPQTQGAQSEPIPLTTTSAAKTRRRKS